MTPMAIDKPRMPEQGDPTLLRGASDIHHRARGEALRTPGPPAGPGGAPGRLRRSGSDAPSAGREVEGVGRLECCEIRKLEAPPDFGLPEPIEVLDRILQPKLARGREDRGDPQLEAEPDHAAKHIPVLVGALEPSVVIELGITGATVGLPVRHQTGEHPRRRGTRPGPRGRHAAVKPDTREDIEQGPDPQLQHLDEVEEL